MTNTRTAVERAAKVNHDIAALIAARPGRTAKDLHDLAMDVASLEVQNLIGNAARAILENKETLPDPDAAFRQFLTEQVLAGPDDTWSGRSNDLARVRFDALRKAAQVYLR